jgi:hypothetical protein
LNTNANLATILYQGLPLLPPVLIAFGCATAGEMLVRGTIEGVRRVATDPLGVARDVVSRVADVRDIVGRMLSEGPRNFFGNLAIGSLNALMDRVDPGNRFHRLEPLNVRAEVGPTIRALVENATGRLDPVRMAPTNVTENLEELTARLRGMVEGPSIDPTTATAVEPVGTTPSEQDAINGLLMLSNGLIVFEPASNGGSKYRTSKNKRKTPRKKKLSKKNLRRRH